MTLRLPEPLPYDFVDELIDSQFEFKSHEYKDENGWWWVRHSAKLRDPGKRKRTINIPRLFMQLLPDNDYEHISSYELDDEGYVASKDMNIGVLHTASKPPLTGEELDRLLVALISASPIPVDEEDCYV